MNKLREDTQASSMTEVIQRALSVYAYVQQKKATGYKMIFRKDDEEIETELL